MAQSPLSEATLIRWTAEAPVQILIRSAVEQSMHMSHCPCDHAATFRFLRHELCASGGDNLPS